MCGEKTDKYTLGACSVRLGLHPGYHWDLDALILSFLAFVLGNRQDSLMAEELKAENKGKTALGTLTESTKHGILHPVPSGSIPSWSNLLLFLKKIEV